MVEVTVVRLVSTDDSDDVLDGMNHRRAKGPARGAQREWPVAAGVAVTCDAMSAGIGRFDPGPDRRPAALPGEPANGDEVEGGVNTGAKRRLKRIDSLARIGEKLRDGGRSIWHRRTTTTDRSMS